MQKCCSQQLVLVESTGLKKLSSPSTNTIKKTAHKTKTVDKKVCHLSAAVQAETEGC